MTDPTTKPPRTGGLDRAVIDAATTLVIVPVGGLDPWTTDRCWEVARLAGTNGRRVALMDLSLKDPMLHAYTPNPMDKGVTDAFLRGVSISAVAQRYGRTSLYFLTTGAKPDNPTQVWASPRWDRLASGFAAEGALLIAFVPPQALTVLRLKPDALVLLAGPDYDPDTDPSPGLRRLRSQGVKVAGVLTSHAALDIPPPRPDSGRDERLPEEGRRFGTHWRGPWRPHLNRSTLTIGAAVIAVALLLVVTLGRGSNSGANDVLSLSDLEPIAVDIGDEDSVFYTVQVAAFNTLDQAMELAGELDKGGLATAVTPVRRGAYEWFRVQYGMLPNTVAADSARRALWADGRVERSQGTILRTPYAFGLTPWIATGQARETARGLRARGIPAYVVEAANGARVLFGAFEEPDQSGVAESLLTAADLEPAIVPRLGIAR